MSEEKTVVTHACDGFDFLGFHIQHHPAKSGQRAITLVKPSHKSMNRLKDKVREMTSRSRFKDNPTLKLKALNAVLRGWMNYYRHCNSSKTASWLNHWVHLRVAKWLVQRHKSCYREILKMYLKQQGNRKNFAVTNTDGSDLFLVMMKDIHITPYRSRKRTNPYLQEEIARISHAEVETAVPDNIWNGADSNTKWVNVRYKALARDGHCCQDCGEQNNLDVHHSVPRYKGGKDLLENLVTLCEKCHVARGDYGRPRKKTDSGKPDDVKVSSPVWREG